MQSYVLQFSCIVFHTFFRIRAAFPWAQRHSGQMRINLKRKTHRHIPGYVRKIGEKGVVFPLGWQNQRQSLEIEIENANA